VPEEPQASKDLCEFNVNHIKPLLDYGVFFIPESADDHVLSDDHEHEHEVAENIVVHESHVGDLRETI